MIDKFLNERCSCADALSFFFGFNDLEISCYFVLVQQDAMTIAGLMEKLSRNQSTVYTAVEQLVKHSIVEKKKQGRKGGGYQYVYQAKSSGMVKQILEVRLDKLYNQLSSCLQSFDNDVLMQELPIEME